VERSRGGGGGGRTGKTDDVGSRVPQDREEVLQNGHAHTHDDVGLFHPDVPVLRGTDVQRVFHVNGFLCAVHVH